MITCDIFEKKSGVPEALKKLTETSFAPLDVGDYRYDTPTGCEIIERKSIADFWSSKFKHRIQDQLYRARSSNCGVTLLIELNRLVAILFESKSDQAFLASIQRQYQVRVMFSISRDQTAQVIYWCYMNDQKLVHRSLAPKLAPPTKAATLAAAYAAVLPGIGPERSRELAAKYPSWHSLVHASSSNAFVTKQISETLSSKIWDYLRSGNGKHPA